MPKNVIAALNEELKQKEEKIRVAATESFDEAFEAAKQYRALGWSQDEIEVVLEDLKYTPSVVKNAMKKLSEYVKEQKNVGPFKMFEAGQLIKLSSGNHGVLLDVHDTFLKLLVDGQEVQVTPDLVDLEASGKLTKAFNLRMEAASAIEKRAWDPLMDQEDMPKETQETFDVRYTQKAPPGFGEVTPEMSQVPEVVEEASKYIAEMDELQELMDSVEEESRELRKQLSAKSEDIKQLKGAQREVAQHAYALLNEQLGALEDSKPVFAKAHDKLVVLVNTVETKPIPPTHEAELDFITKYLQDNYPEILVDMMSELETWQAQNTTLKERISDVFRRYPPSKKKAQLWNSFVGWIKGLWQNAINFKNKLMGYEQVMEQGSDMIESFVYGLEDAEVMSEIQAAVKAFRG